MTALARLRGGLVASCQPVDGGPMDHPAIVAAMAQAAVAGGAAGLRIEGVDDQGDFFNLEITDVKGGALIVHDGGEIFIKGAAAENFSWQGDFAS